MHYRDCGALFIYCGVDPSKTEETLTSVLEELRKMSEGITQEELTRSIEYSVGRLDLRLEDTRAVMSWLGGQELLHSEVQEPDDVVAKIRAITTDQAVAAARTYLNNASYRLAVVGPYDDDAVFQRLLATGAPVATVID